MKITLEQKNVALEIIQKLAYFIEDYNENLKALEEANIEPVYKYRLLGCD